MKTVSRYVCEIRFKPDPKFLDKRGEMVSILSNETFPNWKILDNRVDFGNDKDLGVSAFSSFKNLGVTSRFPHDKNYFLNTTKDFIKNSWLFLPSNGLIRVGIRSSIFLDLGKSFKDYFEGYKRKVSFLSKNNYFKANLVDIGFNLNFANGKEYFNITTGPMDREQAKVLFDGLTEENIPDTGIYVEVDYFKKDFSPSVKQKEIFKLLDDGIAKSEDVASSIVDIVLEKE
jgi:hypothetical protein